MLVVLVQEQPNFPEVEAAVLALLGPMHRVVLLAAGEWALRIQFLEHLLTMRVAVVVLQALELWA
jgi:hypothetical protein